VEEAKKLEANGHLRPCDWALGGVRQVESSPSLPRTTPGSEKFPVNIRRIKEKRSRGAEGQRRRGGGKRASRRSGTALGLERSS
jgi:hypothetical protein